MTTEIPPRLRWACRRGMLELDVLLGNFLQNVYLNLSPKDQVLFAQLLDCNDQELFMWLMGKESSNDPNLQKIVDKIREHARNKP